MHGSYLKLPQIGCEQPAIDGRSLAAVTKQEVSCCKCFHLSNLRYGCRRCTLAIALHEVQEDVQFLENIYAHLKFTVYGRKQTNRHTHAPCNAVQLVWGSLRLAQINGVDVCWLPGRNGPK